jgi:hypothetical protein
VSDIWRSYFAERLFRDLDLLVAFVPPRVTQFRNAHNYLADMDAESDLYFKTSKLIEFLHGWDDSSDSLPGRMESLWVALYERGYIEIGDVHAVQMWLHALLEAGYRFPSLNFSEGGRKVTAQAKVTSTGFKGRPATKANSALSNGDGASKSSLNGVAPDRAAQRGSVVAVGIPFALPFVVSLCIFIRGGLCPAYGLPSLGSQTESTHAYRPDIDGLRTVAVVAVIVFHFFPDVMPGGFVGVDMFFV